MAIRTLPARAKATSTRTATLMLASVRVIRSDGELLLLPALATVACLAVLFGLFFVSVAAGTDENFRAMIVHPEPSKFVKLGFRGTSLAALAVIIVRVIQTFLQAAVAAFFVSPGEDDRARAALRATWRARYRLLGWAALTLTVVLVASKLQSLRGFAGAFLGFLPRLIWAFASFLAIPVLVYEGAGPWTATKRSAALFRRAWGEETVANFSLVVISLPVAAAVFGSAGIAWLIAGRVSGVVVLVLLWVAWENVLRTLLAIFQVTLYRYATDGATPEAFERDRISRAYGKAAAAA